MAFSLTTSIREFVEAKNRAVITVPKELTVRQTLELFKKENILSAPVVNDKLKFLGFVDVLDLVALVVKLASRTEATTVLPAEFFDRGIETAINLSERNPCESIPDNQTIADLIERFCDVISCGSLHRVAVLDSSEDGLVYGILTQSDVVSFITENLTKFDLKANEALRSPLNQLFRDHVETVNQKQTLLEALALLDLHRIQGLAVVDDSFKLIGNISASDLRGTDPDSLKNALWRPVLGLVKHNPVSCNAGSTLGEVLRLIKTEKVRRVYVTNDTGHPVGMVSLGDIIRLARPKDYKTAPNYVQ